MTSTVGVFVSGPVPGALLEALRRTGFGAAARVGLVVVAVAPGGELDLGGLRARFPGARLVVVAGKRDARTRTAAYAQGADLALSASASAEEHAAHLRALCRRGLESAADFTWNEEQA